MLKVRLEKFYEKVVCEDFILLYNYKNIAELPTFERAILNSTSNQYTLNSTSLLQSFCAWFIGTTQKCVITRARKSIALFGIRKSNLLGLKVTLRKRQLFLILDKLLIFVLPHLISNSKIIQYNANSSKKNFQEKNSSLVYDKTIKKNLRNFFTISNQSAFYFPEVSQLLTFFDSLSGFAFSCSIKILRKNFFPKSNKNNNSYALYTNRKFVKEYAQQISIPKASDAYKISHCKEVSISEHKSRVLMSKTKNLLNNKSKLFNRFLKSKKADLKDSVNFAKSEKAFIAEPCFSLSNRVKKQLLSAFQYPVNI